VCMCGRCACEHVGGFGCVGKCVGFLPSFVICKLPVDLCNTWISSVTI
jgi:hypothetical protein